MTSQLRAVLNHFSEQTAPLSFQQMAQQMQIETAVLRDMLDYWVRKGKLREVNNSGQTCTSCGVKSACPFIVNLPRYYERIEEGGSVSIPSVCDCHDGGGCH